MFTFHWSELLVVILGGIILFFGLALLMLRRRNEILQRFLTPEEPNLEEEFFRVRAPKQTEQAKTPPENADETENKAETAKTTPDTDAVRWGTP